MPTTNGCLTNYAEQKLLDHVFNATAWTLPTGYVALMAGNPTDSGAGASEVETPGANGYARVALGTGGSSKFAAASSAANVSNADIDFGPASAAWSTIEYWAIYDASTGGNMIAYGQLTSTPIGNGDSYSIPSGSMALSLATVAVFPDAISNALLDHIVGRTSYTSPTPYAALYEGDPLGAGAETETVGANGYTRQAMAAAMSSASGGSITNGDAAITFGPASGSNWGTIDYVAVFDASSGGNLIAGVALAASKTVNVGDSFRFSTSTLTFTLD